MFGSRERIMKGHDRLMGLATTLETEVGNDPSRYDVVVGAAAQMRNMILDDGISLTMSEKLRVVRSVTKAKIHALISGANYETFKALDIIGSDLVQML